MFPNTSQHVVLRAVKPGSLPAELQLIQVGVCVCVCVYSGFFFFLSDHSLMNDELKITLEYLKIFVCVCVCWT